MGDKKGSNNAGILAVIIILLLAVMWEIYYFANNNSQKVVTEKTVENKSVEITMITDKRCGEKCNLIPIIAQLKEIPSLSNAKIIELDYSEQKAKDIMKETGVTKLPTAIFLDNSTTELAQYLLPTKDKKYSLNIGWNFDPTVKMSDKWFKVLDKKVLENIKSNSYLKWDKNAKVTWIEYSDLECPYCAKLHNSGTPEELEKKYGKDLNQVFQSFPLIAIHKNALPAAEALECLWKEKWSDAYYELKHIAFKNKKSDKEFLIDEAVKLWANKDTITKCIEEKIFADKINIQQETGTKEFWITGTPWNVLINNETWEYEIISGAYPASSFIKIIDKLLK